MKCKQAQDLIGAYIYGDLAPDEMRDLRVHAQDCALCREDLESRGRIVSLFDDSVPALSDEERQRIAWSVKGAVRKEQLQRKPLALRLMPSFALAGLLIAGIFVGRYVVTKSAHPTTHNTTAKNPSGASVRIRELPPPDGSGKSNQIADQVSELIQSLMNPTATVQPDRRDSSTRSSKPDRRYMIPSDTAFPVVPEHTAQPGKTNAQQQPTPDVNSANQPKESAPDVNKSETGTNSEATKLPRVTDPKNAETTPSENK